MAVQDALTPFHSIKDRFAAHNDLQVLSHCLGINTISMEPSTGSQSLAIAEQLAEHTVVICIDTEHWTLNSDEMTEIGITVLHTQDVLPISRAGDFGDHGFNILEQAKFHFFRLSEKTHLPTSNIKSRGPEGNSFGHVRFITFAKARTILRDLLVQPIHNIPALHGYNRPIVLLGHSVGHDREHLNGKDLGFDIDALDTIVRVIDTQQITVDGKHWFASKDPIGLRVLVQKLEFHHTNSHTAANDAARTFIAGVLMTLPKEARQACHRSTQKVMYDLEKASRDTFIPLGGVQQYCSFCGGTGHMGYLNCKKYGPDLECAECVSRGLNLQARSHVERHCPIVRDEVAAERLAWYAGQEKEWKPKYPFSSCARLQAFGPHAPAPIPATEEELVARREFYDKQRGGGGGGVEPLDAFVWHGRSFLESPLFRQGPPPGQKVRRKYVPAPGFPSTPLPLRPDGSLPRGKFGASRAYRNNMGGRGFAQHGRQNYAVQPYVPHGGHENFFSGALGNGYDYQQYGMQPQYAPGHGHFIPTGSFNNYHTGPAPGGFNDQIYGGGVGIYYSGQPQRGRGRGHSNGSGRGRSRRG